MTVDEASKICEMLHTHEPSVADLWLNYLSLNFPNFIWGYESCVRCCQPHFKFHIVDLVGER